MYFSGHMLDGYSKALSDPAITPIKEVCAIDEEGEYLYSDRATVTVAGVITAIKGKTTKNDERMAFFTLEDRDGEVECLAFPKVFARVAHLLSADAVIRVAGTLSIKEDERPTVLVSGVAPLSDDHTAVAVQAETKRQAEPRMARPQNPKILYLRVPSLDAPACRKALNMVEIFDGTLPVSLYDASRSVYQKLDVGFDLTDFTLNELISILGKENVVLK